MTLRVWKLAGTTCEVDRQSWPHHFASRALMKHSLLERLPPNTWLIVTSDHGELFGEDGYFGHGPIQHEKVWEVPFVEGKLR